MINTLEVTAVAATISDAMGAAEPREAAAGLRAVEAMLRAISATGKAERVLCYNPDCVAFWLYQKYPDLFIPVTSRTQLTLPMRAVFPPVTPVCFASMFTGAQPAVHGTKVYDKRLIEIDTVFEALVRSGKKVGIVVRDDSSMEKIFRNRPIDYFVCGSDAEAEATALRLIQEDKYDFLEVYQMDYDDAIHDTTPESELSMAALKRHIETYAHISDAVKTHWKQYDTLMAFAPDHGLHETIQGVGDHYADIPEDMNMIHFWSVQPKETL